MTYTISAWFRRAEVVIDGLPVLIKRHAFWEQVHMHMHSSAWLCLSPHICLLVAKHAPAQIGIGSSEFWHSSGRKSPAGERSTEAKSQAPARCSVAHPSAFLTGMPICHSRRNHLHDMAAADGGRRADSRAWLAGLRPASGETSTLWCSTSMPWATWLEPRCS